MDQLRLEGQGIRCRDCEAIIGTPVRSCPNCGRDDPAPATRDELENLFIAEGLDSSGQLYAAGRAGFTR
ncbi:hypothetical protein ACOQFV_20040 [Nocardiopsis changdeensis]|uniref:Uncharacterized protein n=1 Tax=Nocardiopsis changdeensis TaxID=2831969 RepID=A0ABX8BUN4_9ACTN|nr:MULTISPECIES: hypothetical protein [Nocardiopsis]QUX25623.1 hypothetical protein KGD84_16105 [Nocardiopsis changdeensis]QYX36010.1 hypothetical protein K1J57_25560 [Nocardiopsis sp. MT53]